jgi:biotin-(acetyl-CoA carboxylase) ligase
LGFGVNLAQRSFGGGYASAPCSVLLECGAAPDSGELLELLLAELARPRAESPSWLDEINGALAWKGRDVRFCPGLGAGPSVQGILNGIDASGAIVILVDGAELAYVSGELRLGSY